MVTEAAQAMRIQTDFECGSAREIHEIAPQHYRFAMVPDWDISHQSNQATWYYVRLLGAKDQQVTFEIEDFHPTRNGQIAAHSSLGPESRPFISDDGETWRRAPVTVQDNDRSLRFSVVPRSDVCHIARLEPYGVTRHEAFLREIAAAADLKCEVLGDTAEGRPLELLTITAPGDDRTRPGIFLRARAHPWETGTSFCMEGFVRFLLSDDEAASQLRQRFVFKVMPMANKDGVVHGHSRYNARHDDPNRNWYTDLPDDPERAQERIAFRRVLEAWLAERRRMVLALDLHDDCDGNVIADPGAYRSDPVYKARLDGLIECLKRHTYFQGTPSPTIPAAAALTAASCEAFGSLPRCWSSRRISNVRSTDT